MLPVNGFHSLKRLVFLPVLVSNLYSLYGVVFLNWSVADIFFWFWCEFVLCGMILNVLTVFWARADKALPPGIVKLAPALNSFAFLLILFYASLFTAVAYRGEWNAWDRFPDFLKDKTIGLLVTTGSYLFYFVRTLRKSNHGWEEAGNVEAQFCRRSLVILGLYLVLMFQYHLTGARKMDLSPAYLKAMGVLLLGFKLITELGGLDWCFRRRRKSPASIKGVRPEYLHK
jgi:hypothetical protein